MDFVGFKAYCNNKDVITIINYDDCDVFTINDELIYATLVRNENNQFIFKATFPIEFNKEYVILDHLGNKTNLIKNLVVKQDFFDELFYYDKNDLGATYSPTQTTFKVWAPIASKVMLKYEFNKNTYFEKMIYQEKGVYSLTIHKNLANALYCYIITNNGVEVEVNDIYSFSANANNNMSAVIDLSLLNKVTPVASKPLTSINDAIIYETSIRDFTSKIDIASAGTFKGFIKRNLKSPEKNPIGFDYLLRLGVSHVQLMPITDFVTVDENNVKASYNWGYDPGCFNILEGSYSSNPNNPYSRMKEFIELVSKLHEAGIRVNVDMVFNHTYHTNSIFNKLVPNYFYLMNEEGVLSNGSFCGNDLDTTRKMVKKHIVDMCIRLVSLYGIDGIRLDLMGILTIDTVKEIYDSCKNINPSFILYGEGWNMPSFLKSEQRASLINSYKLPNIAFFNDYFRDVLKGNNGDENLSKKGYLSGNLSLGYHAVRAMRGTVESGCYFTLSSQSINYIECHDNATLYDKLLISNINDSPSTRNDIQLTFIAAILFAQGVPFIHSGMEFNRSKHGNTNSYNAGDEINGIEWSNVDTYKNNILAVRDLISIRNEWSLFHLSDKKIIINSVDGVIIDQGVMKLTIASSGEVALLLFNPSNKKVDVKFEGEYKLYATQYGKINDDVSYTEYKLKPYSFTMFVK